MSAVKNLWNWIGGKFEHNLFGPIGSFFGNISDIAKFVRGEGTGNDSLDSWIHTMTGDAPNGLQLWTAGREDTAYRRAVSDMGAAGLNPALMYGSGGPSVSSAGNQSPTGISDLLQLAMLPLQMEALKADINKTVADTQNTLANTRGVEISNDWLALLNESEINARNANTALSRAEVDRVYTDIGRAREEIELIRARTKSESYRQQLDLANSYLALSNANRVNSLLSYEQALLEAQAEYQNAAAQYALIQKLYQQKLIDGRYIEAVIRSAKANMTVDEVEAWLSSDQFGRENESKFEKFLHSAISGLNIAVKTISPLKTSRSSNVTVDKTVNIVK